MTHALRGLHFFTVYHQNHGNVARIRFQHVAYRVVLSAREFYVKPARLVAHVRSVARLYGLPRLLGVELPRGDLIHQHFRMLLFERQTSFHDNDGVFYKTVLNRRISLWKNRDIDGTVKRSE